MTTTDDNDGKENASTPIAFCYKKTAIRLLIAFIISSTLIIWNSSKEGPILKEWDFFSFVFFKTLLGPINFVINWSEGVLEFHWTWDALIVLSIPATPFILGLLLFRYPKTQIVFFTMASLTWQFAGISVLY